MGSDRHSSSRKHASEKIRWDPYKSPTQRKFMEILMIWTILILFPQTWILLARTLLYIFEDNEDEAVIKMIIMGRSPAMRHVSRTHRVALDWLFDRINLDPNIQIKYIDTKNQLADILTKGHLTRDEWNHLLCLFNISHFSSISSLKAMSKRTPEDASEERVTAKFKADDEFGLKMPCKGSDRACLECIWKPSENQIWKSDRTSELVKCAANKYGETRIGR